MKKTTFDEFLQSNNVTSLWIKTAADTGIELVHDVETDCDEDYCDLWELIREPQFEWLSDLQGEVVDGVWEWDGAGQPRYHTNSVTNVKSS